MTESVDREEFDRAQRRHRRNARLRAIPATLAAAAMGIPLGVYLSPILLALAIVVTDLLNLMVAMPDIGGMVWHVMERLIDGDPSALEAIGLILVLWALPGVVGLVLAYLWVARRLRQIGGDGIALAMGARAPRTDDSDERQLVDIVNELAVAAGIAPPRVLLYDDGPLNALVFGRDHDHATVVVARRLLTELDREETQGVVAMLVASAVDGDLGLALDVGAVYVTYGLLMTTLSAVVSPSARTRWRAAISPLAGRHGTALEDAVGVTALLRLTTDDATPDSAAAGCLTLVTMGGVIGIGVGIINLFLGGPLLTYAWRSRGYLADATAVELTQNPEGLARALTRLNDWQGGVPGTAWLDLLLFAGGLRGDTVPGDRIPRLSDTGLAISVVAPIANRLQRLRAMGAFATTPGGRPGAATDSGPRRSPAGPRGRFPRWLGILILSPLIALVGILLVAAAALIVYLAAIAAFVVLAIVAGPIHELLRALAGR